MSYDRLTNTLELLRETEQKLIEEFLKDIKEINKYYGTTNKLVVIYKKWEKRVE